MNFFYIKKLLGNYAAYDIAGISALPLHIKKNNIYVTEEKND